MEIEIIRVSNSGLSLQTWDFNLHSDYTQQVCIYFNHYSERTKIPPQRKFRVTGYWDRLMSRDSTIKVPPLPHDVLEDARQYFKDQIDKIEVRQ